MSTTDSFEQLLKKATSTDVITVVGALGGSPDEGKFLLMTPDGRTLTLDVAAVKRHKVIAESFGETFVELGLDAKQVPDEIRSTLTLPFVAATAQQAQDPTQFHFLRKTRQDPKFPWWDTSTHWYLDHPEGGVQPMGGVHPAFEFLRKTRQDPKFPWWDTSTHWYLDHPEGGVQPMGGVHPAFEFLRKTHLDPKLPWWDTSTHWYLDHPGGVFQP